MKLYVTHTDNIAVATDSSFILFCNPSALKKNKLIKKLDSLSDGLISRLYESAEFGGKINENVVLYNYPGLSCGKLILAGLGDKSLDGYDQYRQTMGTLSIIPSIKKSTTIGIYLDESVDIEAAQAVVEGFNLGRFKLEDYKTVEKSVNPDSSLNFYLSNKKYINKVEELVNRGQIISEGVILARTLTSMPGNDLTPRQFASRIQKLAKKYDIKSTILDEKQIMAEKMGAFMSVAKGSSEPPRFAVLEYNGGMAGAKPIMLIGKGITFDSGGISLKPALKMDEMKGDMQGAAITVATLVTSARLGIKQNLIGLMPMAENMPSSKATKPGDIVTSRKGKTIEIINTDAEGRLILADALDYANKFSPQAVLDIATLTGAATYVLGPGGVPIMGNNANLIDRLKVGSVLSSEKVWELPLWEKYTDLMKSSIADLKNSGGKYAGTITAAAFLQEFIGDYPWAHIDIAAVDVEADGQPYIPKGVTAIGMRLLIETFSNWKKL
ncbi:MAG: leucyl aminopeptidase [Candidatus Zixiibacteriota bacterium]